MTRRALTFAASAGRRSADEALRFVRWTRPQRLFLEDDRRTAIWRDGNRLGKSWALAYEVIARCRGRHPFKRTHPPPIRALIVGHSLEQMEPLMAAIWRFLPKHEIDDRCGFDPGRGITGKPPRIVFTSGPGAGSVVSFATYRQGSQRVAGGAYHFIGCDEPATESMFGELRPRLLTTRGDMRVNFTPTPDAPPQGWLRDLVEAGTIPEHNYHLSEATVWPEGAPRPLLYQAEIDAEASTWLEVERAMRLEGAWEPVVSGRWLTQFSDANVASFATPDLPTGATVGVGVDHGANAGKQAACLIVVDQGRSERPRVWWCDEVVSDGYTTPEQDASAILAMLRRNGLTYDDVDDWVGDRPTGENRWLVSKSNRDLLRELARQVGRPLEECRRIHTPKKWAGSLTHGLRLVNGLCGRRDEQDAPALLVSQRCETLIEACRTFAGDRRDPGKDILDAARYPTERLVKVSPSWSGVRLFHA